MAGDPNAQAAVQAAIQARAGGTSVPQAAQTGQQPPMQTPQPMPAPQGPGMSMPKPSEPAPESELIVKALGQRLSAISSVEKAKNQPGPQMAPVTA